MLIETFSGIRGIFGDSLTEEVVQTYCLCYLEFLKKKTKSPKIVIGTDTRLSNDLLRNSIIEVVNARFIDVGIASTPAVEFGVRHYKAHGGIIITASHNEPYWNGLKFLDKDGAVLSPNKIGTIIKKFQKYKNKPFKKVLESFSKINKPIKGKKITDKHDDLNKEYSKFVLSFIKKDIPKIKKSKLRIVIDPNGGTGIIFKEILESIGIDVCGVNMDYSVFNRRVEPNQDSLFYLGNIVRDEKAEFGAGFDCDGDRINIVLDNNKVVSGHYLLALIANEMMKEKKHNSIVINDATSGIIKEIARKHHVKLVETNVGEINVIKGMTKNKALIAGEGSSGGVILSPSKCRDGIITLLWIIKIVVNLNAPLKKIIDSYPKYYNHTKNVKIKPDTAVKLKKEIEKYYKKKKYKIKKIDEYEGSIKVIVDSKSFVWFRDSKTEGNVFRIISDSNDEKKAFKLMKEAVSLVEMINEG